MAQGLQLEKHQSDNAKTAISAAANRKILIIGNGPSTKELADVGFDKIPADVDTFGMGAAYRHYERVQWWPTYYAWADTKVVHSHREELKRIIEDPNVGTRRFYFSRPISRHPRFERITHSTTGDFCFRKAVELGYREIYLIGIEGSYVEEIAESRPLSEHEFKQLGYEELNLPLDFRNKLLIITETPRTNPNYFFDDYQRAGDVYSLPQAARHREIWSESVSSIEALKECEVINLSSISRIEAFPRMPVSAFLGPGSTICQAKTKPVPVDLPGEPRDAHAVVNETAVIAEMLADRIGSSHTMLDIGAHHGGSASYLDNLGWTVYCFEPDPKNRKKLVARLGKRPNVKIDTRAVSDKPANGVSFFTSRESPGISGLLSFRETHVETGKVDVTTIAEISTDRGIEKVDFLKIDVEGFDFNVLKGVPWDKLKPDVIEAEFEDAKTLKLGHTYNEVCEYLVARGYAVYLSEWHPIVRYGIAHDWRQVVKWPSPLASKNAWGNILAFREDPGLEAVATAFQDCMKFNERKPTARAGAQSKPTARASAQSNASPLYTRIALWAEANSPLILRLGRFVMWVLRKAQRHVLTVISVLAAFVGLVYGLFVPELSDWQPALIGLLSIIGLGAAMGLTLGYANDRMKKLVADIGTTQRLDVSRLKKKLALTTAEFEQRLAGVDADAALESVQAALSGLRKDISELRVDISELREDAALKSVQAALSEHHKDISELRKDISRVSPNGFQSFNRVLNDEDLKQLAEVWSAKLRLVDLQPSAIRYLAHRATMVESRLYGRLATSIENILLRVLVTMSVRRPEVSILEIGTLFGTGAAVLHDTLRTRFERVHLTLLDPLDGYYGQSRPDIMTGEIVNERTLYENLERASVPKDDVTLIKRHSTDDAAISQAGERLYDVLIIDGDHTYAGVKSDFAHYAHMVRSGGYILFDDYGASQWPDVTEYVDREVEPCGWLTRVGAGFRTCVYRVISADEQSMSGHRG